MAKWRLDASDSFNVRFSYRYRRLCYFFGLYFRPHGIKKTTRLLLAMMLAENNLTM
jgi:hypothetical protein